VTGRPRDGLPPILDPDVALKVQRLIDRGRKALTDHLSRLPLTERPIGASSLNVVLRADFEFHPKLCLDHVILNGRVLYILDAGGELCALVSTYVPLGERP
jgi:hypothetical protein